MTGRETLARLNAYLERLMSVSDAERPAWNQELCRSGQPNKWNYIDGCMMTAVLAMYRQTADRRFLDFADSFVGAFVREDGSIRAYDPEEYNLDCVSPAANLLPLYRFTGKEKYLRAMDTVYGQLARQPRTREGNFWHKNIYPWQVWLDGLYMAMPFYTVYDRLKCGMIHCRDIFGQFERVRTHMRDPVTGLYYHGYDESKSMPWADPETGRSPGFWLRSLGWLAIALCDTLEAMDEQMYYEYRMLMKMLRELAAALEAVQDRDGMFWQVPDHPGESGNYRETSGTAMIAYAFMKAARLRFLPARYGLIGRRAFEGTTERCLTLDEQGEITLTNICLVAGLGGANQRDGSRAYYYSEPVVCNEAKGIAPLLLAMTEMMRIAR